MTRIIIVALAIAWVSAAGNVNAQSIFDSLKKTAEMHNEARGETDNSQMSDEQEAQWNRGWQNIVDGNAEVLAAFDPDGSCVAMMVLYVYEYVNLVDRTDRETDCKRKYDLYGMQLLSLSSSTTILYCRERLAAYSNERLGKVYADYFEILDARKPDYYDYDNLTRDLLDEHGPGIQQESWDRMNAWAKLYFKTRYLRTLQVEAYNNAFPYNDDRDTEEYTDAAEALREDHGFIRHLIGYFDRDCSDFCVNVMLHSS